MRLVSVLALTLVLACENDKEEKGKNTNINPDDPDLLETQVNDFKPRPTQTDFFAQDLFIKDSDFLPPEGFEPSKEGRESMASLLSSEIYRMESEFYVAPEDGSGGENSSETETNYHSDYEVSAEGPNLVLKKRQPEFEKIEDENPLQGVEGTETIERQVRSVIALHCIGQDLSRFDGMNSKDFEKEDFRPQDNCKEGYGLQSQIKSRTKNSRTYKPFDPNSEYSQVRDSFSSYFVTTQQSEDGGPCFYMPNSLGELKGDCIFKDLSYLESFESVGKKASQTDWEPVEGVEIPPSEYSLTQIKIVNAISAVATQQRILKSGKLTGEINGWQIESDIGTRKITATHPELEKVQIDFGN